MLKDYTVLNVYITVCIPDLRAHQLLLLIHRFRHHSNELPKSFCNYFTVNSSVHMYTLLEQKRFA